MGNGVVHFELQGSDPEGTAKFYSQVFGWHTEAMPGDTPYVVIDTHAGKGINGGFGGVQGQPPTVTVYVAVPDPQKALQKAESLGAKTVMPVTEIPGVVTFALFTDPQGAMVGLVKGAEPGQQAGGPSAGNNPPVDWFEILSTEPKKAWDFYGKLFDWKVEEAPAEGFVYGMVEAGEGGIAGGIGSSPDGKPHVNVYARVDDIDKHLKKAESLGGKTIVPPTKVAENTTIAQFADPQGTSFGVYVGM
jgi:predicted enzyme related to lactoylglutathione lyase